MSAKSQSAGALGLAHWARLLDVDPVPPPLYVVASQRADGSRRVVRGTETRDPRAAAVAASVLRDAGDPAAEAVLISAIESVQ